MAIELTDDGTMDTVLRCSECGEEFRFNYDASGPEADEREQELMDRISLQHPGTPEHRLREMANDQMYGEWVAECIAEIEAEHVCGQE